MNDKRKQPLVSILMPVRNAGGFLVEAIESIRNQTYENWELICVNDYSKDETGVILKKYCRQDARIKVINNDRKRGIGYSLNTALKKARGEYIARMDGDDVSLPNRLKRQVELLNVNPDLVACGGQVAMIDPRGRVFAHKKFPTDNEILYKMIMRVVPIQHPVLMARAEIFKNYRYLERVTTAEDVDMLFYLLQKGRIGNVDSCLYHYRKTDMNNGYHNVKRTFFITFKTRIKAMIKYDYEPNFTGIIMSLLELVAVTLLPGKIIVRLYESVRYEPPFWKRINVRKLILHPRLAISMLL